MLFRSMADIVQIAAGDNHFVAVKENGTVWVWGDNTYGQLGLYNSGYTLKKTVTYTLDEAEHPLYQNIYEIHYGMDPSVNQPLNLTNFLQKKWEEVEKNKNVSAGGSQDIYPEETVTTLTGLHIVAAAAGDHHTLLLASDGTVWAFGDNTYGQLGCGDGQDYHGRIQRVLRGGSASSTEYLTDIIYIAADGNTSMALRSDGTVWTWGQNTKGQLGTRAAGGALVPVQVEKANIDPDFDQDKVPDSNGNYPQKNYYLENIFQIAAGADFALAAGLRTLEDGELNAYAFAWGNNSRGQLGIGAQIGRAHV